MKQVYRRLKACRVFPAARVQFIKQQSDRSIIWEAIYEVFEPALNDWFVVEFISTTNQSHAQREFRDFCTAASIRRESGKRRNNAE